MPLDEGALVAAERCAEFGIAHHGEQVLAAAEHAGPDRIGHPCLRQRPGQVGRAPAHGLPVHHEHSVQPRVARPEGVAAPIDCLPGQHQEPAAAFGLQGFERGHFARNGFAGGRLAGPD